MRNEIICADVMDGLARLPDKCVQTVVTSPPYWGLRDYGVDGQIGLEPTVHAWVARLVAVFDEVRRVLRPDGTLWLNIGDAYTSGMRSYYATDRKYGCARAHDSRPPTPPGLGPKNLLMLPARLVLALQDAGWCLRADIVWAKPNQMPESVRDRPTRAHEYVYLLAKEPRYYYDLEATKEPCTGSAHSRGRVGVGPKQPAGWQTGPGAHDLIPAGRYPRSTPHSNGRVKANPSFQSAVRGKVGFRNMRSVWSICSQRFSAAHFATFPEALVQKCLTATSRTGDLVLDPFMGAGTVALVAAKMGREYIGIELNPEYVEMARKRLAEAMPLFAAADAKVGE